MSSGEKLKEAARAAKASSGGWGKTLDLVRISAEDGRMSLESTDGMLSLVTTIPWDGDPLRAVVSADSLSEAANLLGEEVAMTRNEQLLTLSDAASTFHLMISSDESMGVLPTSKDVGLEDADLSALIKSISALSKVPSKDPPKDLVMLRERDGMTQIIGATYSIGVMAEVGGPTLGGCHVVHAGTMSKACALVPNPTSYGVHAGYMYLEGECSRLTVPVRGAGDFPSIDAVLNSDTVQSAGVSRQEFISALEAASFVSTQYSRGLTMATRSDKLEIWCDGVRGHAKSSVDSNGELGQISLSSTLALQVLRLMKDKSITISMVSGGGGVKLIGDNFIGVVATMDLKK